MEFGLRQNDLIYNGHADTEIFDDDEVIELLTRVEVRSRFAEVLSGRVAEMVLRDLEKVFFEVTYPTPPITSHYGPGGFLVFEQDTT
jgi:hypothetical protein